MIAIEKSKSADTRSAETAVDFETLKASSLQHIGDVQQAMIWMSEKLNEISKNHDFTKIQFAKEFHDDFKSTQFWGKDFKTIPWYQRHITEERHHLDARVPDDVNLFDVLERIADIVMAGMARTGKVYDDKLPPELFEKAYKNTIEMLKKQVEVKQ